MTRNATRDGLSGRSGTLTALLDTVQAVPLNERMHHRNEVAAFGASALEAVAPWLDDPRMAAFAIRVIGKVGDDAANRAAALDMLRAARPHLQPSHQSDVDEVLARWGERATPVRIRSAAAGPQVDLTGPVPLDLELRARLVAAAREHRLVTYSEAGEPLGLSMRSPSHRPYICRLLGAISAHELASGRPMLTSIVVKKGESVPGDDFFQLGAEHERVRDDEDARSYGRREMDETFAYWSTHQDPEGDEAPTVAQEAAAD